MLLQSSTSASNFVAGFRVSAVTALQDSARISTSPIPKLAVKTKEGGGVMSGPHSTLVTQEQLHGNTEAGNRFASAGNEARACVCVGKERMRSTERHKDIACASASLLTLFSPPCLYDALGNADCLAGASCTRCLLECKASAPD
jgi:hypothetical protein